MPMLTIRDMTGSKDKIVKRIDLAKPNADAKIYRDLYLLARSENDVELKREARQLWKEERRTA